MGRQARYFIEATKAIASMPHGHCLGALECPCIVLQFPHRVPFTKEKMPLPFQNRIVQAWEGIQTKEEKNYSQSGESQSARMVTPTPLSWG